jgi:hypothetical protein
MRSEEIWSGEKRSPLGLTAEARRAQRKSNSLLTVSHGDIIRKINSYHEGDHEGFGYFLLKPFCALCGTFFFFVNFVLLSLTVFAACANFPVVRGYQNGDLLAPRRQERQVRKFNFFAAFAPLREIIRVLVAAAPRWVLRGDLYFSFSLRLCRS